MQASSFRSSDFHVSCSSVELHVLLLHLPVPCGIQLAPQPFLDPPEARRHVPLRDAERRADLGVPEPVQVQEDERAAQLVERGHPVEEAGDVGRLVGERPVGVGHVEAELLEREHVQRRRDSRRRNEIATLSAIRYAQVEKGIPSS